MRCAVIALYFAACMACAADGDVDTNFGTNGNIVLAPADSSPQALSVAVQDDGKVVVGGTRWDFGADPGLNQAAVWRFLPDGTVDTSFGESGMSVIAFGSAIPFVYAVQPLPNGQILAAGYLGGFGVMRLNSDGSLDPTFASGGSAIVDFSDLGVAGTAALALAVDAQGRILLAGNSSALSTAGPVVARLLPTGQLDASFGDAGRVVIPIGDPAFARSSFHGVAIDAANRLWLSGTTNASSPGYNSFLAVRLSESGKPDASFGDHGVGVFNVAAGSDDWGGNAALIDSRMIIGGSCDPGSDHAAICFLRLDKHGKPDPGYGTQGWSTAELGTNSRRPSSLACQTDRKCMALVSAPSAGSGHQYVVARMDAAGRLDASFGQLGIARIDIPATTDGSHIAARAMAIQGGRPILAGTTDGTPYVYGLFVTRLQNDLVFAAQFD